MIPHTYRLATLIPLTLLSISLSACLNTTDSDRAGEDDEVTTVGSDMGIEDNESSPDGGSDSREDTTLPIPDASADPVIDSNHDSTPPLDLSPDLSEVERICHIWSSGRTDLSEGTWSGSLDGCDPGDISAEARENALRLVNVYRALVNLPAVGHDATLNAKAQACALIMHAAGRLSHTPPEDWTCWSANGYEAASSSNISGTPGVQGVDLYMVDPGNPTTLGHRRWILSNSLGPIGLGSTNSHSCMWVLSGSGTASAPWTAWPPPGPFPLAAGQVSWDSIDNTGWSLQSDSLSFDGAVVNVTSNGIDLPVTVTNLASGYGSSTAISFIADGWTMASGRTYSVDVTNISTPITYDVNVVDCP